MSQELPEQQGPWEPELGPGPAADRIGGILHRLLTTEKTRLRTIEQTLSLIVSLAEVAAIALLVVLTELLSALALALAVLWVVSLLVVLLLLLLLLVLLAVSSAILLSGGEGLGAGLERLSAGLKGSNGGAVSALLLLVGIHI